jgi:hypothetical protein
MTVVGKSTLAANNWAELKSWIQDNKGKVNLANAGLGSASHLCGLMLQQALQTDMTTVPYKGTAPAMADLMGGQVDLMCDQTTNTTSQIEGKKVKAYAVTTAKRLATPAVYKDLPTLQEVGLKGFDVSIWHGLYAPRARRRRCSRPQHRAAGGGEGPGLHQEGRKPGRDRRARRARDARRAQEVRRRRGRQVGPGHQGGGPVRGLTAPRAVAAAGVPRLRVVDSITELVPGADAGCLAVSGSHGGISSAQYAWAAQPLLAVFNDAGVGKDRAGLALPFCRAMASPPAPSATRARASARRAARCARGSSATATRGPSRWGRRRGRPARP